MDGMDFRTHSRFAPFCSFCELWKELFLLQIKKPVILEISLVFVFASRKYQKLTFAPTTNKFAACFLMAF